MANNILAVNEIFGVTFQGEGKSLGMPCVFLRLSGCNLSCVWCDTPYTWDWTRFDPKKEIHPMGIEDVAEKLEFYHCRNLVISGGEPLLQSKALVQLVDLLRSRDKWHIEIETAGTVIPVSDFADQYNVSLKLSHSGNELKKRYRPDAIQWFAANSKVNFKFVVASLVDFMEIDNMVYKFKLKPVYIMPEGIKADVLQEHLSGIIKAALGRGYYITTRLQILAYGNQRGI